MEVGKATCQDPKNLISMYNIFSTQTKRHSIKYKYGFKVRKIQEINKVWLMKYKHPLAEFNSQINGPYKIFIDTRLTEERHQGPILS